MIIPKKEEITAIILAGGLGTRLRPITESIPKPMVEINGKPFLEYKIEQIKNFGIKKIILCVGYLGEKIEEHFRDGKNFGVEITYSYEKELLGTAGAIKNAESLIDSDFFIVLNGDTHHYIDLNQLLSFHSQHSFPITMVITKATNSKEQELVELEKEIITNFYKRNTIEHGNYLEINKNPLINAGVYVLNKEILNFIQADKKISLEQEIFPKFVNRMAGFSYNGFLKDLATIEFCRELEQYIGDRNGN